MLQGTLYLVTDQGPATGIGSYADRLAKLLRGTFSDVKVLSLCYLPVETRPGWIRLPGSRVAESLFEIPRVLRHNYQLMVKELPSDSRIHFCGSSYDLVSRFPCSVVTIHDYYLRLPSLVSVRDYVVLLRDVSSVFAFLTLPRQVRSARERIVPTKNVQERLAAGCSLPSSAIHHWIDSDRFRPRDKRDARERLGLPREEKLVLNVSRGTSNKNYSTLENVANRLRTNYRMVKVGGRIFNAPGAIHFTELPHETYPYLFNACDVYLHTSTQEGFGFPLIDAMASGLPVVSLRTEVATEVLSDAAFFVNSNDPISRWIEAIEGLMKQDLRSESLLRAQARLPLFEPRLALQLYESIYRKAFD